ncbi:MAG: DUF167 domain-containing protein [Gemmataceae bacterium]
MIEINEHDKGCVLSVKAQPAAKKSNIVGEQAGALKVAVTAAPEQGKANKALIQTLAKELGFKKSQVEIVSGQASRDKRFLFSGVTVQELRDAIAKAITS